jgi:hypothetical protein
MEDSKLIFDLLEKHSVSVGFEYMNQITEPVQVNNVIAEIRGREKPDEWILVGAHLDSWDLGMGCQDNGTGSVMVLETARAIAELRSPPRRSIRFALWTGEEPGLLGSKAYVKAHWNDLDHCVAVLNSDDGAGHPLGWKVDGRSDLRDATTSLVSGYLQDLAADGAQSASSNGKPRLHHSYVIDQAGQQAYVICRGSLSDGDARASAGSTWVENIRMPRRRSLRHWCYGCTGQASSIPKRWTNLESSLFSLSFERSLGIRAGPLVRWECTGALSFALFEN